MLDTLSFQIYKDPSLLRTVDLCSIDGYDAHIDNSQEYVIVKNSKFFDASWYLKHFLNNDKNVDPVAHFCSVGWRLKLPASLEFSTYLYLEEMKEKSIVLSNPIVFYETHKSSKVTVRTYQYEVIMKSNLFDREWYRGKYSSIITDEDELEHYLSNSRRLNVNPNNDFDVRLWCQLYPKLTSMNEDPFFYYICKFKDLRNDLVCQYREILKSGLFDKEWYEKKFLNGNPFKLDPLLHYMKNSRYLGVAPNRDFSSKCYYDDYKDVFRSSFDALFHYLKYGKFEKRKIKSYNYQLLKYSKYIDDKTYKLNNNLDKKVDAFANYLSHYKDNIFVSDCFDETTYLEAYPDVKKSNVPGLVHYLYKGRSEGRKVGVFPTNCVEFVYESNDDIEIKFNRALVFAGYLSDGIFEEYQIYLIEQLSKFVDCVFYVCDSPIDIASDTFSRIRKFVRFAQFKKHNMYDFGSYKIGFERLKRDRFFNSFNQILFANDSIIGPVGDVSDFFEYANKSDSDMIGLCANHCGYRDSESHGFSMLSYHVQSYFFVLKKSVFHSSIFGAFLEKIKHEENKIDIIMNLEMGFTRFLQQNNFKVEPFVKSKIMMNPSAHDCINVLIKGHFVKTSQIKSPEYREKVFNQIFLDNDFPFRIVCGRIFNSKDNRFSKSITTNKCELINVHMDSEFYYFLVFDYTSKSSVLKLNIINLFDCSVSVFDYWNNDIYKFGYLKDELEDNKNNLTQVLLLFRVPVGVIDSLNEACIYFSLDDCQVSLSYLCGSLVHKTNHLESKFYTYIRDGFLYLTKSPAMYKSYLLSIDCNPVKAENALKLENIDRRYILFSEKDELKCDNAFMLFNYLRRRNNILRDYVYYITDKNGYESEKDPLIKDHLVIRDSQQHIDLFLAMAVGVFTFDMSYLRPKSVTDYQLSVLYKKQSYILLSHGYSGGYNNTCAVGSLYYGKSDIVICSSKYEFENFRKMGYNDVRLLGYPRFDKWMYNIALNDNAVTIFFTFRRSLLSVSLEELLNSTYVKTILQVLLALHKRFPQLHINYVFHNALSKHFKELIGGVVLSVAKDISLIDGIDASSFNTVLSTSKYVITDYSSVGFDMSYDSRRYVFFYVESNFIKGHYCLCDSFNEQTSLANINVSYSLDTLMESLNGCLLNNSFNNSINNLFAYHDSSNSKRCADALIGVMLNKMII